MARAAVGSPPVLTALIFALAASAISGGTPNSSPSFEVASVKPSPSHERLIGLFTWKGGRISVSLYTLEMLVEAAFDVQAFQISGGPGWIHTNTWDLVAIPPASSKTSKANPPYPKAPPNDEQRQMLQTLLMDRFQLRFHRRIKEGPIYRLEKGHGALELRPAADPKAYPWAGILTSGLEGIDISAPLLATRLSGYLEHPVLDRTGLAGSFDFKTGYTFADPAHPDLISCVVTSVRQLGLALVPDRGPVETIVIDHAEKPSAN